MSRPAVAARLPIVKAQVFSLRQVHHLVGAAEIAVMLGVSRQRVQQLAARPDFPVPAVELSMGKVWHTKEVTEWARGKGREVILKPDGS